jgi:hypothetical protein
MSTHSTNRHPHLMQLLDELCDQGLPDEKQRELESILTCDRSARLAYVRYMDLQAGIREHAAGEEEEDGEMLPESLLMDPALYEDSAAVNQRRARNAPQDGPRYSYYRPGRFATIAACATLLAVVGGVVLWLQRGGSELRLANRNAEATAPVILAKLEGAVGATWAGEEPYIIEGTYFPQGTELELREGLAEIQMASGARVVLQGPASVGIESGNAVQLAKGRVAAYVPADCGPFFVKSDRGTLSADAGEFGAEVDEDGSVEMRVYYGKVTLAVRDAYGPHSSLRLTGSEGARLEAKTGELFPMLHPDHLRFVRYLSQAETVVSLAELVAGDAGTTELMHSGIHLKDGERVGSYQDTLTETAGYLSTTGLSGIDGVFVPDGSVGSVQVDSIGRRFAHFPVTSGKAWSGAIMARRPSTEHHLPPLKLEFQDGVYGYVNWLHIASKAEELSPEGHGLIGIHSNGGITFDLHAIRRKHPNCEASLFRALVGNLEAKPERFEADAWVLVDGEQRYFRRAFSREDGPAMIEIPLTSKDRFLVLAVTDSGGDTAFDWVAFGDAVIEMRLDPRYREF